MEYMDKNTNKKEITKLANQTFQENRLKEQCMTILKKIFKTYTRKNQIKNDYINSAAWFFTDNPITKTRSSSWLRRTILYNMIKYH